MDGQRRLPDFLVVGAQKSGTTTVHAWLRDHPDAYMASPKELHFFDRHYGRGLPWYSEQFASASAHQVAGEATPEYMYLPGAMERLATDVPAARLLVLLRDPVERAYSHYHHSKSRDVEPLTFREALEAEPDRLSTDDVMTLTHFSYLDRGRYAPQVRRIMELFPDEQVMVELFESVRDHPRQTYRQVAEFAGVDPSIVPETVGARTNRYKSPRLRRLRRHFPKAKRLRRGVARLDRMALKGYPPMSPADRAFVTSALAEDREELTSLTGLDLSSWQS